MNPSVKDRLGSVVRALSGVVLPALPQDASLAQEQVMLAMGHIQIILAQMDAAPGFVADQAADFDAMGTAIAAVGRGGPKTTGAVADLQGILAQSSPTVPEARTVEIQDAIDYVLIALAEDGDAAARATVIETVLAQGALRADKDRQWFAAMGFDIEYSGG